MNQTPMIDRNGKRVRYYCRKTEGPTKKQRKAMRLLGQEWCRECKAWHSAKEVHSGLCKHHGNEQARKYYSADPEKVRQRKYARRRKLTPIPSGYKEQLIELTDGKCVYCGNAASTLDHFFPVSLGGQSEPGNLLPCCISCNSKKKNKHPNDFQFELTEDIIDLIIPGLFRTGQTHLLNLKK